MSNELLRIPGRQFRESFTKQYNDEELAALRVKHIDILVEVDTLQRELKDFTDSIKEQLKPLIEESKKLLPIVKNGQEFVSQDVFYDIDEELATINFIDPNTSEVIGKRKMTREERLPLFTNNEI
jgi:hypothetical protein